MASTATVVGAGIAGLAAAAGLARLGWDVTVIERGQATREDGAGLTLWPNALRALDAIGAGDAVRDIGAPVGGAVVRRADGKKLAEVPVAELTARYGPLIAVHRTELHRVLADGKPLPISAFRHVPGTGRRRHQGAGTHLTIASCSGTRAANCSRANTSKKCHDLRNSICGSLVEEAFSTSLLSQVNRAGHLPVRAISAHARSPPALCQQQHGGRRPGRRQWHRRPRRRFRT